MSQAIASRKIPRNFLRERTGHATPRLPVFFSDHLAVKMSIRAVAPHGEQFADAACQSISKCHVHLGWHGIACAWQQKRSIRFDAHPVHRTQCNMTLFWAVGRFLLWKRKADEAVQLLLETSQGEPSITTLPICGTTISVTTGRAHLRKPLRQPLWCVPRTDACNTCVRT